jgi:hypothetical protein
MSALPSAARRGGDEQGPDLGLPMTVTAYITEVGLRALMRDPKQRCAIGRNGRCRVSTLGAPPGQGFSEICALKRILDVLSAGALVPAGVCHVYLRRVLQETSGRVRASRKARKLIRGRQILSTAWASLGETCAKSESGRAR